MGLLIDAVCRAPADSQLVVHHTERSGEHERGSTSLEAAADLRVKAEREGASPRVTLTCKKGKDTEEWSALTLHAEHLHGSRVLWLVTDPAAAAERSSRPRPHQPCVSPSESSNVRGRSVAQPR